MCMCMSMLQPRVGSELITNVCTVHQDVCWSKACSSRLSEQAAINVIHLCKP